MTGRQSLAATGTAAIRLQHHAVVIYERWLGVTVRDHDALGAAPG